MNGEARTLRTGHGSAPGAPRDGDRRGALGHTGPVAAVAWTPDGERLVSAGQDGALRLWDPSRGVQLGLLVPARGAALSSLALSPDGRRVLVGCSGATVMMGLDGAEHWRIPETDLAGMAVAWSPDGARVAASHTRDDDGEVASTVVIRDARSGAPLATIAVEDWVRVLAWSPDGRLLAGGVGDAPHIWDTGTAELRDVLPIHAHGAGAVAWSPGSDRLTTGCLEGSAGLWRIGEDGPRRLGLSTTGCLEALAWSPDDRLLALVMDSGAVHLLDPGSGRLVRTIDPPELAGPPGSTQSTAQESPAVMGSDSTGASALAWHPGGHLLATGHADGGVRIWQAPHGRLRRALGGGAPSVRAFAPSSAGAALAIVMDEALHLIDMASGRPRLGIHAAARITSLAWSADGALLAVEGLRVGGDGAQHAAWVVEATTGAAVMGPIEAEGAQWSPVGSLLATGGGARSATIWEAGTGRPRHRLDHPDEIGALSWAPMGALGRGAHGPGARGGRRTPVLATGCEDGAVRLWSGATGELLTVLRTGAAVRFLAWEPGSQERRLLAVGFWEHPPQLWDVPAGRLLGEAGPGASVPGVLDDGVGSGVDELAWAAPGVLLTEQDQRIARWDAEAGRWAPVAARGRWNDLADLHPAPDGQSLVDGRCLPLRLCDARTLEPRRDLAGPALRVGAVAWSPDSSTVMAGGAEGTVRMWEAATGEPTAWVVTGLPGGGLLVQDCAGAVIHCGPPPVRVRLPDGDQ
ncbi:MAG: hypothetical protein Q4E00_07725 [Actinomyces bowdenii]|nr:hypothetical protein [Actinomyces bowdenii]